MGVLEIVLLFAGVILAVLSFALPVDKGEIPGETKQLAREEVKVLAEREMNDVRQHINGVVDEAVTYAIEKTERALERLTNEKIMAVNEYSDTVLQEIHKDHDEAMFLYDMLNSKHTSLTNEVSELHQTMQELEEAKRGAEAAADSLKQLQMKRVPTGIERILGSRNPDLLSDGGADKDIDPNQEAEKLVGQILEKKLGQGLRQSLEQSLRQSIGQDLRQSMEQGLRQSVEQSLRQSIEQNLRQSMEQGLRQSIEQDLRQSLEQNPGQSPQQGLGQEPAQGIGQGAEQSSQFSPLQSPAQNPAQGIEQSVGAGAEQSPQFSPLQSPAQNPAQGIEQSVGSGAEQSPQFSPLQSPAQNPAQGMGQSAEQSPQFSPLQSPAQNIQQGMGGSAGNGGKPGPAMDLNFMTAGEETETNNKEQILKLYGQGKSKIAIARELGLGVGEVKLVIDLYKSL